MSSVRCVRAKDYVKVSGFCQGYLIKACVRIGVSASVSASLRVRTCVRIMTYVRVRVCVRVRASVRVRTWARFGVCV